LREPGELENKAGKKGAMIAAYRPGVNAILTSVDNMERM